MLSKFLKIFCFVIFSSTIVFGQVVIGDLEKLNKNIEILNHQRDSLMAVIEEIKLGNLKTELLDMGIPTLLPGEELVCHSAYCLVYSEKHEVAKWVAHIISNEIVAGGINRTNDFRVDSLIKTGSSEEEDYFLTIEQDDGTVKYDGFGYDRGHLAPSADFRWSEKALSESFLYSNMTPQLPDFNRKKWVEIESFFREYIYNNPKENLFVVTAPVLTDTLPKITRGKNQVSIPEYHYKIAMDYENKIGIAFLVSQYNLEYPIESYVVSIDSIESITGINFFPNLSESDEILIESTSKISEWRNGMKKNDVAPFSKAELPKNCYSTVGAEQFYDYPKDVTICGTVVSAHKSKKGHIFLNLDKSFPNQMFTATIWKSNVINYSYAPEVFLINKRVCIKGKVKDYQGVPSTYPENEKQIEILK